MTAVDKEQQYETLTKEGLTRREANRLVYGWSEPKLARFWQDLWEDRDGDFPAIEQKDAFYMILKTSFGQDYDAHKRLLIEDSQMREICCILVAGIEAGHIHRRRNTKREPTRDNLLQTARTELNRLLNEDERFTNILRQSS